MIIDSHDRAVILDTTKILCLNPDFEINYEVGIQNICPRGLAEVDGRVCLINYVPGENVALFLTLPTFEGDNVE